MSGSLKTRPCLPKTMPRTSFKSSIESEVTSAGLMLLAPKSKVSQVFTAAYSSCAFATEKAEHRTSDSSGRDTRAKLKRNFIRSFLSVASPKNEALPHGRATARTSQKCHALYRRCSCLPNLWSRSFPTAPEVFAVRASTSSASPLRLKQTDRRGRDHQARAFPARARERQCRSECRRES